MDILVGSEGALELRVLRDVSENTKLDLRVVARDEHLPVRGDKCLANLASDLRANRDVLQIRLARREAARGRDRLIQGRMDPAGVRVDEAREGVRVGALQFSQLAILEDPAR